MPPDVANRSEFESLEAPEVAAVAVAPQAGDKAAVEAEAEDKAAAEARTASAPVDRESRSQQSEGVTVHSTEDATTVIVSGEIDITLSADLKAALVEAFETGKPVEIDALRASYMDVTALELLWAARQLAVRKGVVFKPGCAPAAVGPLLTQLGMGELEIFA